MAINKLIKYNVNTVLTIAGFDPSGGAGIQGDTKTITSLGGYATNVLTSLPIQNTYGVKEIFEIPPSIIEKQLQVVFEDMIPKAIKIGMLHCVEIVEVIVKFLKNYDIPIIFDPVMIATSGDSLVKDETVRAFTELLFPLSTLITPNLDEASVLVGEQIDSVQKMQMAGPKMLDMNLNAVLIKGGHLKEHRLTSILFSKPTKDDPTQEIQEKHFETSRLNITYAHGAGCTLSSAIATYLSHGQSLSSSVKNALFYVDSALHSGQYIQVGEGDKHELIAHLCGEMTELQKTEIKEA